MKKVVLLTGGSSGIGLATAEALVKKGCRVYEMSRRPFAHPSITHIPGDVTSQADARRAVELVLKAEGRIDILVNNAGFGISGAAEFTPLAAAEKQMKVNFLGCANLCSAVIDTMRSQKGGRIVNLSSVAAIAPIPFQAFYSASKAAINAYTMALGNEVRPFGISVCAVMPGDIQTGFTAAREKETAGDTSYNGKIGRSVAKMEHDEQFGMKPDKAGAYIAEIALKKRVKPLYAIRLDYKAIALLLKLLPASIANCIIGMLYAA